MKITNRCIVVFVLAIVFTFGCTVGLPVEPKVATIKPPAVKLPIKVGLVIDSETRAKRVEETYIIPGTWRWSFVYPVGEALEKIASPALLLAFSDVQNINTTHPLAPGLHGAIHIVIDEAFMTIPFVTIFRDEVATSTILLKGHIYDKKGEIVATLVSRGFARGSIRAGGWTSPISPELLGPIADQALQHAMSDLARKLLEDDRIKRLGSLPE